MLCGMFRTLRPSHTLGFLRQTAGSLTTLLGVCLLATACASASSGPVATAPEEAASEVVVQPTTAATEPTAAEQADPAPTDAPVEPTTPPTPAPPTPAPPTPAESHRYPSNTGTGVTVVIIDRGIDYDHPDFLNPDGTTRIKAILDMSGQSYCTGSRESVEYSEDQINVSLASGEPLGTDDYVGHGTATAGAAAGNGLALEGAPLRGPASTADLVIVKATSEGATNSVYGPGEPRFDGCATDLLAWVDAKITELDQPAVAIWNAGVQWGPIDGTSQLSREIEAVFGPDNPGRIWVAPSGDEGGLPNHAGGAYAPGSPLEISFVKEAGRASFPTAWISGSSSASITIQFNDGPTIGPIGPGESADQDGVAVTHYAPGSEFYPWTSTSGDTAVWMSLDGIAGPGTIRFQSLGGEGTVDLYGDLQGAEFLTSAIEFTDSLVPGRLTDFAGNVERDTFESESGRFEFTAEGERGDLWSKSSDGPTRDGRYVLDVTAAGQNAPAALG